MLVCESAWKGILAELFWFYFALSLKHSVNESDRIDGYQ